MTLLTVVAVPHPSLRKKAEEVKTFDAELELFTQNMLKTMYEYKGIGLAANQVDVLKRVITLDCSEERNEPMIFVNPEIIHFSEEKMDDEEGCLSLPTLLGGPVTRSLSIVIKAQNVQGEFIEYEAEGLVARCIQHEVDHLNGILFIDYLSRLKQERILKKLDRVLREIDQDEK